MALRDPHPEYDPRQDDGAGPSGAPPSRPTLEVIAGAANADLVPERPLDAARGIVVALWLSVVLVWLPLAALLFRWLRG